MKELSIVDHPLVQDRLTRLRDQSTGREEFARLVEQLGILLACEAGHLLRTEPVEIQTPMEAMTGDRLSGKVCLVPILRAGLGLLRGFQTVFPEASVGHLGLKRDEETLRPAVYLEKLPPDLEGQTLMVLDPMLATGHSACEGLKRLKAAGARSLVLVCCLAAPEGIREVRREHPDVPILTASLDRQLNEKGYVLPGLGDAGDRQFGTE